MVGQLDGSLGVEDQPHMVLLRKGVQLLVISEEREEEPRMILQGCWHFKDLGGCRQPAIRQVDAHFGRAVHRVGFIHSHSDALQPAGLQRAPRNVHLYRKGCASKGASAPLPRIAWRGSDTAAAEAPEAMAGGCHRVGIDTKDQQGQRQHG